MVQCSVCGADVHKEDEPEQTEYEGETYYFDSTDCQEQFEGNSEEYA